MKTNNICCIISIFLLLCGTLSSCSPWYRDIDRVYKAAREGDKNAMFAVVIHYDDFEQVVPKESFRKFQQVLIEDGNHEIIQKAMFAEWDEYDAAHPKMSEAQRERKREEIFKKWYQIGIDHNCAESYSDMAWHYAGRYVNHHNPQDSIRTLEYRQLAWENWHNDERIRRDREAGIIALLKGGIAYGNHVYQETDDFSFIPRLFNAGMFFSQYVFGGLSKILFSSRWWVGLIVFIVFILIFSIPSILLQYRYHEKPADQATIKWGTMLGLWNLSLIFVAYCNDNPNWVDNVGALWFPEASYGLQPYLCVIPNLYIIYLLLRGIISSLLQGIKHGEDLGRILLHELEILAAFAINYLMVSITGIFYLFIFLTVFLMKGVFEALAESSTSSNDTSPTNHKIPSNIKKACLQCPYFEPGYDRCSKTGSTDNVYSRPDLDYEEDGYGCPYR